MCLTNGDGRTHRVSPWLFVLPSFRPEIYFIRTQVNGDERWELKLGEQFGDECEEYNRLRHRN